jgi:hypothetical protein
MLILNGWFNYICRQFTANQGGDLGYLVAGVVNRAKMNFHLEESVGILAEFLQQFHGTIGEYFVGISNRQKDNNNKAITTGKQRTKAIAVITTMKIITLNQMSRLSQHFGTYVLCHTIGALAPA